MTREEKVDHPIHYNKHSMECIDEMLLLFPLEWVKGFCACNAWKYRERAPYKGTQEEDNKKADWYLAKLKELQED